jgi:phage tail-like protein
MATSNRQDPFAAFRFRVEVDGIQRGGFHEVSGLDSGQEAIAYREGNEKTSSVRKLPGLRKDPNLVFKRGITQDLELWQWRKLVLDGQIVQARRNGAIILLDDTGADVARWVFVNAWPSKYIGPRLNATGNEVAIETLELVHEGLERTS